MTHNSSVVDCGSIPFKLGVSFAKMHREGVSTDLGHPIRLLRSRLDLHIYTTSAHDGHRIRDQRPRFNASCDPTSTVYRKINGSEFVEPDRCTRSNPIAHLRSDGPNTFFLPQGRHGGNTAAAAHITEGSQAGDPSPKLLSV